MDERFRKQIDFIIEIDKIKSIFRKSKLFDNSRFENDAEHSWHLAIMAILLSEYSNEPVDLLKVMKMVLIHDIVEIDAGDTIIYSRDNTKTDDKEILAANRIFGLLPEDQKQEMIGIWQEFEEKKSPEAKFAGAIDRLEPIMQNYYTEAYAWKTNNIPAEKILSVNNSKIKNGSDKLWDYAKSLIDECVDKGLIK
jgi:putative hydrolase of HD superfamily